MRHAPKRKRGYFRSAQNDDEHSKNVSDPCAPTAEANEVLVAPPPPKILPTFGVPSSSVMNASPRREEEVGQVSSDTTTPSEDPTTHIIQPADANIEPFPDLQITKPKKLQKEHTTSEGMWNIVKISKEIFYDKKNGCLRSMDYITDKLKMFKKHKRDVNFMDLAQQAVSSSSENEKDLWFCLALIMAMKNEESKESKPRRNLVKDKKIVKRFYFRLRCTDRHFETPSKVSIDLCKPLKNSSITAWSGIDYETLMRRVVKKVLDYVCKKDDNSEVYTAPSENSTTYHPLSQKYLINMAYILQTGCPLTFENESDKEEQLDELKDLIKIKTGEFYDDIRRKMVPSSKIQLLREKDEKVTGICEELDEQDSEDEL